MTDGRRPATTRLLGGRYELLSLLATGGMGQVWRARDIVLQRPVAAKVLRSEYTGDATFVARFRAEAQHTALLSHRNIAAVFDYGETSGDDGEQLAYLVMELVEGESLAQLLRREGRLGADRTLDVLHQAAAGLAAAHAAGLVHRDVKPGNVLVGSDGTVKLTDFGIAWSAASVPLTQTGQVVGTAHYLAPEQAAGAKAGFASDVYALGMIGYECLAGHRAFDGENSVQIALRQLQDVPAPLPVDVPEQVRILVDRALLKDPAERFADGAAFAAAVDDVRRGVRLPPLPARRDTRPLAGAPAPRSARTRLVTPLVALVVGAGLGIAALQVWSPPAAEPGTEASTVSESVLLVAGDYLGRPVTQVQSELAAAGFAVDLIGRASDAAPAGSVLALTPVGAVVPGAVVTVTFAEPLPLPPPEPVPQPVPQLAPQPVQQPAPQPVPQPAPQPVPQPAPVVPEPLRPAAPGPVPVAVVDEAGGDGGPAQRGGARSATDGGPGEGKGVGKGTGAANGNGHGNGRGRGRGRG